MDSTALGHRSPAARAVALGERLTALPAVATPTWPDLAAGALTLVSERSLVCVFIGETDPNGGLVGIEAAGAAGSHARGRTDPQVLGVRSTIERLPGLGFAVPRERVQRGFIGQGSSLLGAGWARSPIARAFGAVAPDELLIGIHALGPGDTGRVIAAVIGVEFADDADRGRGAERAALLEAGMPLLTQRALLAVGSQPSNTSRWLTSREQAVLERLTLGKCVREIAEEIGRSPHTVHDHVKSLHRKLNASSRGELVARALGYIDDSHHVLGNLAEGQIEPKPIASAPAELASVVQGEDALAEPKPVKRAERLNPNRPE